MHTNNITDIAKYFNQYIDAYYHISGSILTICSKYLHNDCLNCPFKYTLFKKNYNCEFGKIGALDVIIFTDYCEQIIKILEDYYANT